MQGGAKSVSVFFFFQAEDGIRDRDVTGVQTCALPIWRVVDPADQVPPHGTAVPRPADARRPAPDGVMRVVSGRFVLHPARLDLDSPVADPDVARDGNIGPLARPHVLAFTGRAYGLNPAATLHAQECAHASGVGVLGLDADQRSRVLCVVDEATARALRPYLTPGAGHEQLRVLPHLPPLPIPDQPERLTERAHLDSRGAEQELVGEGPDVAPPLAPRAAAP